VFATLVGDEEMTETIRCIGHYKWSLDWTQFVQLQ